MLKLLILRLASLCIAITGKIDQIPLVVDEIVVYEQCLSGCCRCLRQFLLVCQRIDKARLTHIRTAYEGIFGLSVLRTLLYVGIAYHKARALYNWCAHVVVLFQVQRYNDIQ